MTLNCSPQLFQSKTHSETYIFEKSGQLTNAPASNSDPRLQYNNPSQKLSTEYMNDQNIFKNLL